MAKEKFKLLDRHFLSGKSLTQLECTLMGNTTRLSSYVFSRRRNGWNIVADDEPNSEGDGTHARYRLVDINGVTLEKQDKQQLKLAL